MLEFDEEEMKGQLKSTQETISPITLTPYAWWKITIQEASDDSDECSGQVFWPPLCSQPNKFVLTHSALSLNYVCAV